MFAVPLCYTGSKSLTQGDESMHRKAWAVLAAAGLCVAPAGIGALCAYKFYRPNHDAAMQYPVQGIDVSEYQGKIDWLTIASQDISFAFIKATEGSGYTDPYFSENFSGAQAAGLRVGAYHFFSYDSSGKTQAENFIAAVSNAPGMLPPVVDIEYYGRYYLFPQPANAAQEELDVLLQMLEDHYGCKPILYTTARAWRQYICNRFEEYPLWLRSVYGPPGKNDPQWMFWQYTDRGLLSGFSGPENFVDRNVFFGTSAQFKAFGT